MTTAERDAWLARFPQLRTFRYRDRGAIAGATYLDGLNPVVLTNSPLSEAAHFLVTINGDEYDGRHTYMVDRGVETPLTTWTRTMTDPSKTVKEYDWIVLPVNTAYRWFMDQKLAAYYCPRFDPLAERTISVYRDTVDYQDHNEFFSSRTVSPSMTLIDIKPDRVFERAVAAPADLFLDHPNANAYLTLGTADLHVYDRLYLYEAGRGEVPMPPELRVFLDHTWFQFPPYVSRSRVGIELSLPVFAFNEFMRGFWVECDFSPYQRVLEAARAASSARDRTLIDTQLHDTVRSAGNLFSGQVTCGSQVRV